MTSAVPIRPQVLQTVSFDRRVGRFEYLATTASLCRRAAEDLKALPDSELAERMLDIAAQCEADARAIAEGARSRRLAA